MIMQNIAELNLKETREKMHAQKMQLQLLEDSAIRLKHKEQEVLSLRTELKKPKINFKNDLTLKRKEEEIEQLRSQLSNRNDFSTNGGVSLISSRLMAEGPLGVGQGSWMVAGRRTYIDPVLKAIRGASDNLDGLGYYFYDVNGKINTQLTANDNLMVSVYGGDDDLTVGVSEGADSLSFDTRWGNRALTGHWTRVFSPVLFGRMIALYSKYQSDITLDLFDTPIAVRNRVRDVTFKGDLDYFAAADHHPTPPSPLTTASARANSRAPLQRWPGDVQRLCKDGAKMGPPR